MHVKYWPEYLDQEIARMAWTHLWWKFFGMNCSTSLGGWNRLSAADCLLTNSTELPPRHQNLLSRRGYCTEALLRRNAIDSPELCRNAIRSGLSWGFVRIFRGFSLRVQGDGYRPPLYRGAGSLVLVLMPGANLFTPFLPLGPGRDG
jgi:hypothetical protein